MFSNKRYWMTVVAVWAFIVATDVLFHGMWLSGLYQQTAQFWRSQEEIQSHMPWMWVGNFFFAAAFTWIYSKGLEKGKPWGQAFRYGLAYWFAAGLPAQMVTWAMTPYPTELVVKWVMIMFVQSLGAAYIVAAVWKPAKAR